MLFFSGIPQWLSGKDSAMQEDTGDAGSISGSGRSPGRDGNDSRILAGKTPRTEPSRLQLQRAGRDNTHMHALHASFFPVS